MVIFPDLFAHNKYMLQAVPVWETVACLSKTGQYLKWVIQIVVFDQDFLQLWEHILWWFTEFSYFPTPPLYIIINFVLKYSQSLIEFQIL